MSSENTLEAQWVGLHDLTAKDAGSIPGWGNSCKSLSMAKKKMSTNFDEASMPHVKHKIPRVGFLILPFIIGAPNHFMKLTKLLVPP